MSKCKCLNRFGESHGSEINCFRPGQFLSFETEEEALDDGTDLEYHLASPSEEDEFEYPEYLEYIQFQPEVDDVFYTEDYGLEYSAGEFAEFEAPDEVLDNYQISQAGGSTDKSAKVRRLRQERQEETIPRPVVKLSDLPDCWQARGRSACKDGHRIDSNNLNLQHKVRELRKANHRKARETIRKMKVYLPSSKKYSLDSLLNERFVW